MNVKAKPLAILLSAQWLQDWCCQWRLVLQMHDLSASNVHYQMPMQPDRIPRFSFLVSLFSFSFLFLLVGFE